MYIQHGTRTINDGLFIFEADIVRIMCARVWRLDAEFDVADHPQLANSDTNQFFFSEYLPSCVDGRAGYLADRMN